MFSYARKSGPTNAVNALKLTGARHVKSNFAQRRNFVFSKLCNDSGVSVSESMAAARHDSIGQHWKYITQDNASEVNRLKAMGFAQD